MRNAGINSLTVFEYICCQDKPRKSYINRLANAQNLGEFSEPVASQKCRLHLGLNPMAILSFGILILIKQHLGREISLIASVHPFVNRLQFQLTETKGHLCPLTTQLYICWLTIQINFSQIFSLQ